MMECLVERVDGAHLVEARQSSSVQCDYKYCIECFPISGISARLFSPVSAGNTD
jgi:hypothetical protein